MIYAMIIAACVTGILIVGQPRSFGAVYWNRLMLMIVFWTFIVAFLDYVFEYRIWEIF